MIPPIGNPSRFWNQPVGELPGMAWQGAGNVVGATWERIGKVGGNAGKIAAVAALAAGTLYAGSKIVGAIRNTRKYQEPEPPQQDPALDDPYASMQQDMAMGGPQTLMGQQMVEGAHAQRVLAARGQGPAVGVDASAPGTEQDGRSTIDGRPIEDLGAFRG